MTDSVAVFGHLGRVLDANGNPVANAKCIFTNTTLAGAALDVYSDSGLSTSLGSIVYTDSGGYPVSEEAGSTKVTVYNGTTVYALKITNSTETTTYKAVENQRGALDTSTYGQTSTSWATSVSANASDFDAVQNTLHDCDCSGGEVEGTLPSAVTAGNGARFGFRHNGSANQLVITGVLGQNLEWHGTATTSIVLTRFGQTVWLVSNGVNWVVEDSQGLISSGVPTLLITDRLSTPPGSPTAGARYILTASPSGVWSSYAEDDVVEWDGTAWRRYDLSGYADAGMLAYVIDEDVTYQYKATAWVLAFDRPATQAEQEAAEENVRHVTPGTQHHHPSAAKAWVNLTGSTGSINSSHNIASVNRLSSGVYTITFTTEFSDVNYAISGVCETTLAIGIRASSVAQSSVTIQTFATNTSANIDPTKVTLAFFGDQ